MTRQLSLLARCALLVLMLWAVVPAAGAAAQPADARFFPQTGYRVADDAFWTYFQRRGGVRTFGYPVSNTFTLYGFRVQVFQRAVLQLQPSGAVTIMNVLDDGLLPYTHVNGSSFPAADPEVIARQPQVGEPDYHAKALRFVRETAPDAWKGLDVGFFKTFSSAVRAEEAFPNGGGSAGLLLGFNLEIWGLPTSKPTADPANAGFVYQRFQRGIMHYDAACRCTQGLLLADYLKSVMMLRNLPLDLAEQAAGSPLYGQFDPSRAGSIRRPAELPASDLTDAFKAEPPDPGLMSLAQKNPKTVVMSSPAPPGSLTPNPPSGSGPARPAPSPPPTVVPTPPPTPVSSPRGLTVFVDPGHGGKEIGASFKFDDGTTLVEKDLNLKVATRLAALLREAGFGVVMSRTTDVQINATRDLTGDGKVNLTDELQARVDAANAAKADLLVSVHFNGIDDPSKKGTQTFYSEGRPFTARSKTLAELVQSSIVRGLRGAGYQPADRGATTDSRILGSGHHYYLLGPASPIVKRPSEMPGIIGEALFVTNPEDAAALRQEKVLEAIARGYAEAVGAYFEKYPK